MLLMLISNISSTFPSRTQNEIEIKFKYKFRGVKMGNSIHSFNQKINIHLWGSIQYKSIIQRAFSHMTWVGKMQAHLKKQKHKRWKISRVNGPNLKIWKIKAPLRCKRPCKPIVSSQRVKIRSNGIGKCTWFPLRSPLSFELMDLIFFLPFL